MSETTASAGRPGETTGQGTAGEPAGARPWVMWSLGASFYFLAFFHRVTPGVMIDELMRDLAVGAAVVGNLSALYFYAYGAVQVPLGLMLDRWGPRRILAAAAAACGLGSVLFAVAGSVALAYLGRLVIGASVGFALVGTFTIAALWFPARRFALLSGLTLAFGTAGAVGGLAPLAFAVDWAGWRATMLAAAVLVLVLAALIWLVVREADDATAGAAADGAASGALWRGLKGVLATGQTWIAGLVNGLMHGCITTFAGLWGVPYLMLAYGLERPAAAACASLVLVGVGIGAPAWGWLSDRIGRRRTPMVAGTLTALAAMAVVIYAPGVPLGVAAGLLLVAGFAGGATIIVYATGREHNRPEAGGTAMGVINTVVILAMAGFAPIVGWLLDLTWDGAMAGDARVYSPADFRIALVPLMISGAGAAIAAALVRETHCRPVAAG